MSEWEQITLKQAGVSLIDCDHKTPVTVTEGIPYVTIPQIKDGHINLSEARCISEEDFKIWTRKANPQTHDIVLSRRCNPGESAYVSEGMKFALGQNLVLLRADNKTVLRPFLRWLVRSPAWWGEIKKFTNFGSVFNSLKCGEILHFNLPIPPIKEQEYIIKTLSCLDAKIENLRRQNETLEQIAQTLFKHWFIDFEFPNADGKPYKSSRGAMFASELGDIPEGWKSGKLEKFCTVFRGSSPRPISSPVFFENGNIPWIKIADATRSNSIYLSETREHCTEAALPYTRLLKKGSLILSNSATVGVPMILNLEGCIHDGWLSFKDYKVITRNFLFFVLVNKLSFLMQYADGSVQKNLNTGILNNMDFILPSLELITKFTNFSQSIFDKILSNENQISTLTKTRDSLLPKLMSGQLRVKS